MYIIEFTIFVSLNGRPAEVSFYFTEKAISIDKKVGVLVDTMQNMDWSKERY